MKKYTVLILAWFLIALVPHLAHPFDTDVDRPSDLSRVVHNMKEKEKTVKTLTAKFVQTRNTRLLKEPLTSVGTIYFDAPGIMLFKVTAPSPVSVLLKNRLIFISYPGTSKTKEKYLGSNILRDYFGIGKPVEELEKYYSIELTSVTDGETYHLKLVPRMRAMAKRIQMIEMDVTPMHWLPEKIYFTEQGGDSTLIQVEYTSINKPLPEGIFTIDIPRKDDEDS